MGSGGSWRQAAFPTILRYPAIAEEDEKNRFKDEPLFPQHKSLPFLMERRAVIGDFGPVGRASISRTRS